MRLLVLGGTRFVGRAIVDEACSRGYDVTTFSRGISGHPRPGAEALRGDRTNPGDLRRLADRDWDGVIDTSVLAPAHVLASAQVLADHVRHYTYISTTSVYAGFPGQQVTEDSPALDCPPDATGTAESLGYGQVKAGSERAVTVTMPGRCLIVRPGIIAGPHETVGWLTWWLARLARGGTVLAPGAPDNPVRMTDVRDLAAWVIDNTRRCLPATINVPGAEGATFGALLATGARLAGAAGYPATELRWTPDRDLLDAGVGTWMELPMWAPGTPEFAGVWQAAGDRALRTGMRYRPLTDTVRDTWSWLKQEAAAGTPVTEAPHLPGLGMDPAREAEILATLG
jgi:nucleoside-diphosphate-sugar epimerase